MQDQQKRVEAENGGGASIAIANAFLAGLALVLVFVWKTEDAPIVVLCLILLINGAVYANFKHDLESARSRDREAALAEIEKEKALRKTNG